MKFNFSKHKTKSGVPLWIFSAPHFGSVAVGVAVKAGTRDEIWPKEAGIAHALEHMHFQGTVNFPTSRHISEYIEEVGGCINARTNKERTLFYSRVPYSYAERAVHILSEQIKNSIFPEEKIPVEMKNIIQEIRKTNDNPTGRLWVESQKFIYNSHPLARNVLGTEESVQNFRKEDLASFKKRLYDPANYNFAIVGNIKPAQALKLFNKYFLETPQIISNRRGLERVERRKNKNRVIKKEIEQTHISMAALIPSAREKSFLHLGFFSQMLSGGMSYPLFQEIRDKLGLCYSISADVNPQTDIGVFDIYIGTDHKRYKEAIRKIFEVIEKHKSDKALLEKVKNSAIGDFMLGIENTGSILKKSLDEILFLGKPRDFHEIIKEIKETRIKDITNVVNKYLKPEQFYITILAPKDFKIK